MALESILTGLGIVSGIELVSYLTINSYRNKFQWLITKKKDAIPKINKKIVQEKYFAKGKGFDPELGWIRKPNSFGYDYLYYETNKEKKYRKTKWTINERGARFNPNHEQLDDKILSCYGDSFTFARQVNDDETWEHNLSKLGGINALNFGVGNYGLDQALLRLEREFPKNPTKIVIMGVVPDTISRIISYWKHLYEYGNVWAFKPRFELNEKEELKFVPNLMDKEEKFFKLKEYINELREHDYFYKAKFQKDLLRFPYSFSLIKNPKRNFGIIVGITKQMIKRNLSEKERIAKPYDWPVMDIIRKINLEWTVKLYNDPKTVKLLDRLIDRFIEDSKKFGFKPIFTFLPQKNEVLFYKQQEFYKSFIDKIKKKINVIDTTKNLLEYDDLDSLYSEKTIYGAHYNKQGNAFISEIIYNNLRERKLI